MHMTTIRRTAAVILYDHNNNSSVRTNAIKFRYVYCGNGTSLGTPI